MLLESELVSSIDRVNGLHFQHVSLNETPKSKAQSFDKKKRPWRREYDMQFYKTIDKVRLHIDLVVNTFADVLQIFFNRGSVQLQIIKCKYGELKYMTSCA